MTLKDPLIVDLDGDGIQLIDVHTSDAHFDYGGAGFSVKTGWAAPTEGILIQDVDNNLNTVTASELFGAISGDAFADLAGLDTNHDGKIDAGDTSFAVLKVWVDADSDGTADTGEVVSLASAGVTAINLNTQTSGQINNGNTIVATATFVRTNGTTATIAEVNFATDTLYSQYTPPQNFQFSQSAILLPSLVGYGNVPDLIYSMSLDSDLEDAARDLVMNAGSLNASAFQSAFETFVQSWAGVDGVDPSSRGPLVDARHVTLVEAFYGATYAQLNGASAALNGPTVANIEATYHAIIDELMIRFAAQVPLSHLLNGASLAEIGGNPLLPFASIQFNASSDTINVDLNNLVADIVDAQPAGATEQVGYYDLMARLIKSLRVDLYQESASALTAAFNTAADETDLSNAMRALIVAELAAVSIIDASNATAGSGLADAIVIDEGGHTVTGKEGSDTYVYLPGLAGSTTIDDNTTSGGDKLLLVNANPSDVTLSRIGASNDVTISVTNGGSVTLHNEFVGWGYGVIETVQFADGTTWTVSDMMQLLLDQQSAASSGSVYGFEVNDTLVAGAGGKYLSGGLGNDTYVYASGGGNATIDDATSVSSAADTLVLTDIDSTDATITRVGTSTDVLITFSGGGSVTIKNQLATWDYGTIESVQFADDVTFSAGQIREIAEGVDPSHVTVLGTSVAETLVGTAGADVFDGLGGDDVLQGSYGTDIYRFGAGSGNDRIEEVNEPNTDDRVWLVDLLPSDVQFARVGYDETIKILSTGETLTIKNEFSGNWTGIERVQFADGTSWDWTQLREAAWIRGTSGNDTLNGTFDADTLDGGAGNDLLDGGANGDTYIFGVGSGSDTIAEGASTDAIDTIRLSGLNPSDVTLSRSGQDLVITINATGEKLTAASHFYGTYSGIEQIVFADGTTWDRATILSKAWIRGTSGNDTLNGTFDADTLDGGAGNDAVNGGANGDTYVFGVGSGNDTIGENTDSSATDTVKLVGLNAADVTLTRSGQDLIVAINSSGEKITIAGHFWGTREGIEQIAFADGTTWNRATIQTNAWIRGTSGNDTLNGSADPDTLDGGPGNDTLNGGAGSDTYVFGTGSGNDTIGENTDSGATDKIKLVGLNPADVTLSRTGMDLAITINATGEKVTVANHFWAALNGIEQIIFADQTVWNRAEIVVQAPITGTSGNDSLFGSWYEVDDAFLGGLGNDYLEGRYANDTYIFRPGDGQDTIVDWGLGSDLDVLSFTAGILPASVSVTQLNGSDIRLSIGGTSDSVTLGRQLDGLHGGVDQVRFADGTVWDRATLLQMATVPTASADTFYGDYAANTLSGGGGNDILHGRAGNDVITGGAGNDTLSGDGNDDTYGFNLGDGQDTIREWGGSNSWGGSDKIQFGPGIAAADLAVTEGTGGSDLVISIAGTTDKITIFNGISGGSDYRVEQVRFEDGSTLSHAQLMALATTPTSGNDLFYGDEVANTIGGGAGNDTLHGRAGNDLLTGGTGNDTVSGDGNDDTYVFNLGDGQDTVKEWGGSNSWGGNDTIQLGAAIAVTDLIVTEGVNGNNLILAIAGTTDQITILNGISGGSDYRVEQVRFDDSTTLSHAQLMALATTPTPGNDVFYGDELNNALAGGAGNDTLNGRAGNDTLEGGGGNDNLTGGSGNDTFLFGAGFGQDTIMDFSAGSAVGDVIEFHDGIFADYAAVQTASQQVGSDVQITVDATTSILLKNVVLANLHQNDFAFV